MFPFVDFSNITLPPMDFVIDQYVLSILSQQFPGLSPLTSSPAVGFWNTSDSSISSAESSSPGPKISPNAPNTPTTAPVPMKREYQRLELTSSTASLSTGYESGHKIPNTPKAPGPMRNKRQRNKFCKVCQKNITEEGKRSQGTRRHILQHHLCRPLFFCPHCPATSNYDKAHISTHMERMHKGLGEVKAAEKHTFIEEEDRWFKRCFGSESIKTYKNEKETQKKPELHIMAEIDNKENVEGTLPSRRPSPILFSIDRILSDRPWNC